MEALPPKDIPDTPQSPATPDHHPVIEKLPTAPETPTSGVVEAVAKATDHRQNRIPREALAHRVRGVMQRRDATLAGSR